MLDITKITKLKLDGVVPDQSPEFTDAFFCSGEINGRELTDDELNQLTHDYPEVIMTKAFESFL
jgi:hypothetical protein